MSDCAVLGDLVVPSDELLDRSEEVRRFREEAATGRETRLSLSVGEVNSAAFPARLCAPRRSLAKASEFGLTNRPKGESVDGQTQSTPIGPNKPLLVMLSEVYVGDLPRGGFGTPGMVAVSSMKDLLMTGPAPRALNIVKSAVKRQDRFFGPAAPEEGTQVIAYTPAVTSPSLTLTLEIAVNRFPKEAFNALGDTLKDVGALPLLLPAQGYIAAAGVLTKMAGAFGEMLWDSSPGFQEDLQIRFSLAGHVVAQADFYVVTRKDFNPVGWRYQPDKGLMDPATNDVYKGPNPYVVVSLDGAPRDELKAFAPLALSASLSSKFFSIKDGAATSMALLGQASQLLNDFHYRELADIKAKALNQAAPGEKAKITDELNGLLANIQTEALKPRLVTSPS